MTGKQKIAAAISAVLSVIIVITALYFIIRYKQPSTSISVTGVVLAQDKDPQKQAPVAFANITAATELQTVQAKADVSGLFHLSLLSSSERQLRSRPPSISVKLQSTGYEPRDLTITNPDDLQVLYMKPVPRPTQMSTGKPPIIVSNMRVRYAEKATVRTNVGSAAKTFEVANTPNIPCKASSACSPDGKWKASIGSVTLESPGNEFRNVRLSCIAGPCAFTKPESELPAEAGDKLTLSVRNWSSTATFLLEAEVTQIRVIDAVRESYPAHLGNSMTFTMPATAQGPSIEADMSGSGTIIYPLGPELYLSWASCTVKVADNNTKLFRCDLKPGYEFK